MSSTDSPQKNNVVALLARTFRPSQGLDAKRIVLTVGFLIMTLICLGVGLTIHELRLRDMNEERRTLAAIDILLVQETEHALQSVDLVLINVADKLNADNLSSPRQFAARESDRTTFDMLKTRIIGVP
ncbi:MAG: hypothetical protein ABSC72_09890, partial [Methylovirgula sp.]